MYTKDVLQNFEKLFLPAIGTVENACGIAHELAAINHYCIVQCRVRCGD